MTHFDATFLANYAVLRGSSSALGPAGVHVQVLPLHADSQRQRVHLHPRRNLSGQVQKVDKSFANLLPLVHYIYAKLRHNHHK